MKKRVWTFAGITAVSVFLAGSARADMMTYDGLGLNATVKMHAPGHMADGQTVYAGQYLFTYQGTQQAAWCVDIDADVGTTQVTQESYTVLPNAEAVAYLYDTYAGSLTGNTDAAALAACIWEVITERPGGPFNIGSGSFSISGNTAVSNRAASMLASIPGSYTPGDDLVVLHSSDKQDMLVALPMMQLPEPGTLAMIAGGLAFFQAAGRRRGFRRGRTAAA